jgi:hypothetical protein
MRTERGEEEETHDGDGTTTADAATIAAVKPGDPPYTFHTRRFTYLD